MGWDEMPAATQPPSLKSHSFMNELFFSFFFFFFSLFFFNAVFPQAGEPYEEQKQLKDTLRLLTAPQSQATERANRSQLSWTRSGWTCNGRKAEEAQLLLHSMGTACMLQPGPGLPSQPCSAAPHLPTHRVPTPPSSDPRCAPLSACHPDTGLLADTQPWPVAPRRTRNSCGTLQPRQ